MKAAIDVYHKEHHSHPKIFTYSLKIGEWKDMFEAGYFKLLIAGALNEVVRKNEFRNSIAGYLLSDRRLCLVLVLGESVEKEMFVCLNEKLKKAIMLSFEEMRKMKNKNRSSEEAARSEDFFERLFTAHPLKNLYLVPLITGRDVELPYYNVDLERLKNKIRNYPFCSAIDYGGAEGPVKVRLITKKEWEEIEYWEKEKFRR